MCTVSMIMDHYSSKWQHLTELPQPTMPIYSPGIYPSPVPAISPEEIEEFRQLLERAREYDRRNNEPDCELIEKKNKIKELLKRLDLEVAFL